MIGPELTTAMSLLSRLPGLGPRSARRLVLYFLKRRTDILRPLMHALQLMDSKVQTCATCYALDTLNPCQLCSDTRRSDATLCIVADVSDVWALERSQIFKGRYHVLGGLLSAVEGISPAHLTLDPLLRRLKDGDFQEIVLALNATIEGQTTMHYIVDILQPFNIKLTTLAHGVPVGGELDYLDDGTLHTAFAGRRILDAA